jgi:hypothetical protein
MGYVQVQLQQSGLWFLWSDSSNKGNPGIPERQKPHLIWQHNDATLLASLHAIIIELKSFFT